MIVFFFVLLIRSENPKHHSIGPPLIRIDRAKLVDKNKAENTQDKDICIYSTT